MLGMMYFTCPFYLQKTKKYFIIYLRCIMNNFEVLNHYTIPSDVLMDMLSVYRLLGMNNEYQKKLVDQEIFLEQDVIEKDTYYLSNFIGISVSDARLRQLISKNAIPKNKEEEHIVGIKKVIKLIRKNARDHLTFNGSDILDYLNLIFGKQTIKFTPMMQEKKNNFERPLSIRLVFERMLEDYHAYVKGNLFEHIFLSVIAYMEIINLKPYNSRNELAAALAIYYMILSCDVISFSYVSFFALFTSMKDRISTSVAKGSINYQDNYLKTTDTVRLFFKLIDTSYQELVDLIKNYSYRERAFKSDVLEVTIIQKMPTYFTKDDVRRFHPDASDSTINRTLFKLRDENIIMPLGKGRSARWMKLIKDDDPRVIFGVGYGRKN